MMIVMEDRPSQVVQMVESNAGGNTTDSAAVVGKASE